jgi:hypothetical protein
VPYKIGTKLHPDVVAGQADVGEEDYVLDLNVHYRFGANQSTVLCPRVYGKPCPACEAKEAIDTTYGRDSKEAKEGYKKYGVSRRVFYYAIDPSAKEKKIQLFESSFKMFQKELFSEAKSAGKKQGLGCVPFAEWPKGCTVEFRVEMEKNGGTQNPFPEYKSFKFEPRTGKEYPTIDITSLPGLDALMVIRTTAQLEAMFNGEDDDEEEDDAPVPKPAKAKAPVDEDEEEEDPAPTPAKRSRPVEDEPEEEVVQKCPVKGGRFGVTIDDFDECASCKLGDACSAAYRANIRKK